MATLTIPFSNYAIELLPIEIYLIGNSPAIIGENNVTVSMLLSKPPSKPVLFELWNGNVKKFTIIPCKLAMHGAMQSKVHLEC